MLKKGISISLAAMLLIGMAAIFPVKAVTPGLYIDPAASTFYTNTKFVGDTFTVNINVADVTSMYAYEFRLKIEYAKINLTSAVRPAGHFMEPSDIGNQFVAVWKIKESQDATYTIAHFGFTLLAPEVAKTGSGLLVTLTFKIMVAPTDPLLPITSLIDLYDTKLADDNADPIVHTVGDGTYEYIYYYVPPEPIHYLSVIPDTKTFLAGAPIVGTANAFFDVYIDINDLNYAFWVIGIEFKLGYDPTLIDLVSIDVDPWLESFGDIFLVPVFEGPNYIHTAVVLLPHSSPPSVWNNPISTTQPFPSSGHLVKLAFELIHQEAYPWYDESPLDLYDAKYANVTGYSVPSTHDNVDGLVKINGFVVGRQIDMYTQYPGPYGGQGPHLPSDMFWPQKQVELWANVTYNLWPEQNKIVAFEIHNPQGEIVDIITAISDENGVAHTSYRIPWPCFNTSALFGIWTVIATVDIACVVVNDTMQFHFDYMVGQWWKVTTDKPSYAHGETVHVIVDYGTYAIQHYPVLFTAVMHDELNYPVSKEYKSTVLGDLNMQLWCQYDNGTVIFDLPIYKYAHAGVATIRINALSDFPWFAGSAWCPETSITVAILPS